MVELMSTQGECTMRANEMREASGTTVYHNNRQQLAAPAARPCARSRASGRGGRRGGHGAVAGQARAQPARLLQPLSILFKVLVIRLHFLPPALEGPVHGSIRRRALLAHQNPCAAAAAAACPADGSQSEILQPLHPHGQGAPVTTESKPSNNSARRTCRGRTCGRHQLRTCRCQTAPWGPATAARPGSGRVGKAAATRQACAAVWCVSST